MEDYDGQEIEVCRQVNTGLYIIRIDHLLNRDDWVGEDKPWACEALKALVIEEDFDVTNPVFLGKKIADTYISTAALIAGDSSSVPPTVRLAATFAERTKWGPSDMPEEITPGVSFPATCKGNYLSLDSSDSDNSNSTDSLGQKMPKLAKAPNIAPVLYNDVEMTPSDALTALTASFQASEAAKERRRAPYHERLAEDSSTSSKSLTKESVSESSSGPPKLTDS